MNQDNESKEIKEGIIITLTRPHFLAIDTRVEDTEGNWLTNITAFHLIQDVSNGVPVVELIMFDKDGDTYIEKRRLLDIVIKDAEYGAI